LGLDECLQFAADGKVKVHYSVEHPDALVIEPLSISSAAFGALSVALAALWAIRPGASRNARWLWLAAGLLSVLLALAGDVIDIRGGAALTAFAGICLLARRATHPWTVVATHGVLILACAALFVHVIPGFQNPVLAADVVLGPEAQAYTKHLNYDKGMAALLLLALYAPGRTATDRGARPSVFLWRFAVLVGAILTLTLVAGYVRWDPKLPSWWPAWLWSMAFLTALPEEALFRGCLQTWIERGLGPSNRATVASVLIAGTIFGIAHAGGGATYVLLSAVAGAGYGWIYASTRSLAMSALAHTGLNTVHFLLFTYPALAHRASIF
jgi:membrane protease YdiL (CAAX protease family)